MWVADSQSYLCSVCSAMPLEYVLLMLTDLKKDQVLKTYAYAYCMHG